MKISPSVRRTSTSRHTGTRGRGRTAPRRVWTWEKVTLLVIVLISAVSIILALILVTIFSPERTATITLKELADEYYKESLYPSLIGNYGSADEALAEYTESGVPTVYLRQLLLYDNGKNQARRADFASAGYNCDTNHTGVRFFPEAPFGQDDYRVEYYWSCDKNPNL